MVNVIPHTHYKELDNNYHRCYQKKLGLFIPLEMLALVMGGGGRKGAWALVYHPGKRTFKTQLKHFFFQV